MHRRTALAVVAVAALGGGAVATVLALRSGSSEKAERGLQALRLPTPAARQALRDYGKIVFQAGIGDTLQTERGERTESADVYVVNTDGSGLRNLTAKSPKDVHPVWSPDGRRIAFASWRHGGADIYTMNHDGSGVKRLTRLPVDEVAPLWSYDGKKIAFRVDHGLGAEIWVVNADGSGLNRLLADARQPLSWSPDGRLAAISADHTLLALRPDGSNPIRLAGADALNADLAWSPDGRVILYQVSSGGLGNSLYFIRVSPGRFGGRAFPVDGESPVWSPDGKRLALKNAGECCGGVFVVRADGKALRKLVDSGSLGDWSPDGAWLAFGEYGRGPTDTEALAVVSTDGKQVFRLTPYLETSLLSIGWQPQRRRR